MTAAATGRGLGERLTEDERKVLQPVFAGRSTMPAELVPAVERILTARVAAAKADGVRDGLRRRHCGCVWCCAGTPPEKRGPAHIGPCHPRADRLAATQEPS